MAAQFANNPGWMQDIELPDGEKNPDLKKTIGFLCMQVADFGVKCQKVEDFTSCANTIGEITKVIQTGGSLAENATSKASTLQDLVNRIHLCDMKNQCTELLRPLLEQGQTEISQAVRNQIAKELQKATANMACEIVKNGAYTSGLIILLQFVKLCSAWKNISTAGNITDESREALPEIETNMTTLKDGTEKLTQKMIEFNETNDEKKKMQIASEIHGITTNLNAVYIDTRDLISDIKLKISGQIERINLCADEQVMDGITNAVQTIANLVQINRLGGMVSTSLNCVQAAITTGFFLLTIANAKTYIVSHQALKELRATMKPLAAFDRTLKNLRKRITDAEIWYRTYFESLQSDPM